ncbi:MULTISPECIES: hypothetical protein [unclassified Thioalkalivibrio]|uniref:hypothetical protein n=1 Tax=unclassified Thioalkalivibrio TaxID=2621013 RepID=UPI00036E7091|nr:MULTISPECIES: hypothetical protein [unclassified Thioalkalivibrio]
MNTERDRSGANRAILKFTVGYVLMTPLLAVVLVWWSGLPPEVNALALAFTSHLFTMLIGVSGLLFGVVLMAGAIRDFGRWMQGTLPPSPPGG